MNREGDTSLPVFAIIIMNNYDLMMEAARKRFLTYDSAGFADRPGVLDTEKYLEVTFFGEPLRIEKKTGHITVSFDGFCHCREGNFGETLSVFDWLCDKKPNASASDEFCCVASLPGVYVGGSGLALNADVLAADADRDPEGFQRACLVLGGTREAIGDLGFRMPVFQDLPMLLKFYFSDGEFPAAMTLLWNKNTLQFVRYETVYYLAGCLLERLRQLMAQ